MGLFDRKRLVVSTVLVGIAGEGRGPVFEVLRSATRRIAEEGEDFDVTLDELVRVVETLLEHESSWSHLANWGEVFSKEEDAAAYGEESFADAAGRYLSSSGLEGTLDPGPVAFPREGALVVTLTVGYEGESRAIEKTLATRNDLAGALTALVAEARKGRVALAHLHLAPASPEEALDEDRLLTSYPELLGM